MLVLFAARGICGTCGCRSDCQTFDWGTNKTDLIVQTEPVF